MEKIIDAKGKSIGRVASNAAVLLRGKTSPSFKPNVTPTQLVKIINVSKIKFFPTRSKTKKYSRYTGYPGGLRQETLEKVIEKKGYSEVMLRAVKGMLHVNKLKTQMMKNLTIIE